MLRLKDSPSGRWLWIPTHGNSESHAGIGVTAAWPRQESRHADQTANLKLPTQRRGAVGIFALQGGEEVKCRSGLLRATHGESRCKPDTSSETTHLASMHTEKSYSTRNKKNRRTQTSIWVSV